jgi:hypothetical protein
VKRSLDGAVFLVAIAFAVWAAHEAYVRFHSAYYNGEVFPVHATERLGGKAVLEFEFTARHRALTGLWLFFDAGADGPPDARLVLAVRRPHDNQPFWSQSVEYDKAQKRHGAILCVLSGLSFVPGERYVMTYAMPEVPDGRGWRVDYFSIEGSTSVVRWSNKERAASEPPVLWLETRPDFPRSPLVVGLILLAILSLLAREKTRLAMSAWLIMAACCLLVASYGWQFRLWQFWGSFWPDEYPALGHTVARFLRGQITFQGMAKILAESRSGQGFFVPLAIGVVESWGFSLREAYTVVNTALFFLAVAALWRIMRCFRLVDDRAKIAIGLLFFSHVCVIRAVGSLQTDLGGLALTVLFAWTMARALAEEGTGRRVGWLAASGVAGFFAAITRVALVPLLLVPVGLFFWSSWFERGRAWRERGMYLVPTAVGGLLLAGCWTVLGLWASVRAVQAFSALPEFRAGFSWTAFAGASLWGLQVGLPALVYGWRGLFTDRVFTALAGAILGLEALLGFGRIVPWLRYWAPLAVLGIVLFIWVARARQRSTFVLWLGWVAAGLNGWLLWHDPLFAF